PPPKLPTLFPTRRSSDLAEDGERFREGALRLRLRHHLDQDSDRLVVSGGSGPHEVGRRFPQASGAVQDPSGLAVEAAAPGCPDRDRKSTRLNSSHSQISY